MSKWKIEKLRDWCSTCPVVRKMKWIAYPKDHPFDIYGFKTKKEAQEFVKKQEGVEGETK